MGLTLRRLLTIAGTVPFLFCALFIIFDEGGSLPVETWYSVMITYGAVIFSFLGGSNWGLALSPVGHISARSRFFAIYGVTISLTAWLCLLYQNDAVSLMILLAGFTTCMLIDYQLALRNYIDREYLHTRLIGSVAAVGSVAAALYKLLF